MASELEEQFIDSINSKYLPGVPPDVTLVINGQEIKVHKNILASRNKVLKSLLTDKAEGQENVVELDDDDIAAFKGFLKYLYTLTIDNENLTSKLIVLVDKYEDQTLKERCENYLCENIHFDNAIDLLFVAKKHGCLILETSATMYIAGRIDEFLEIPKFDELLDSEEAIKTVLKQQQGWITGMF